ncbi:MAG: N-acetyltransferase [Pirellulales bacterium]
MTLIETERSEDQAGIRAVHLAAFPTPLEADLVDRLRDNGRAMVSLVAREGDKIAGHVLFSPVTVHDVAGGNDAAISHGLGLAPVAVLPVFQRRGVGAALVEAGLAGCRESATPFVVVLGKPAYYARFGFEPASRYRLDSEYNAGDAFQVLLLQADALPAQGGLVRYGDEFAGLG